MKEIYKITCQATEQIYIGKTGIFNDDYEVVVTDWRAPISSLYYDSKIDNISQIL